MARARPASYQTGETGATTCPLVEDAMRKRFSFAVSSVVGFMLATTLACGGLSSSGDRECPRSGGEPSDAAAPTLDAATADVTAPAPRSGVVTFIEASTVTSMQRTFRAPLPKGRQVGDVVLAVWRAPEEPSFIEEPDAWSVLSQVQVGSGQVLWVAMRRIDRPVGANDPEPTFHSADGYQEMTFLLYRGARAVEPMIPTRVVTSGRDDTRAPFSTAEGRPSRAIYVVTSPGPGPWNTLPSGYRQTSKSDEAVVFESEAMLAPASAEAPLLRLRPVPALMTAFAGALVAE